MTTPHRTLQMALDALDAITDDVDGTGLNTMPSFDKALDAIAALREALAAPPAAPAPAAPVPDGMVPNAGEVICPNCAHQFRAIPENVQSLLLASGHEPPFTASPAAPVPDGCVMVPLMAVLQEVRYALAPVSEYGLPGTRDVDQARLKHVVAMIDRAIAAAPAPAAPAVPNGCEKIFTHKWLDPDCIEQGCKSLAAPVVPLTDEQIRSMWKSSEFRGNGGQVDWFCEGIRAAEAHHGITGGKP